MINCLYVVGDKVINLFEKKFHDAEFSFDQ